MSTSRPAPGLQHLTRLAHLGVAPRSPSHHSHRPSSSQASTSASPSNARPISYWHRLADWLPVQPGSTSTSDEVALEAIRLPGASVEEAQAGTSPEGSPSGQPDRGNSILYQRGSKGKGISAADYELDARLVTDQSAPYKFSSARSQIAEFIATRRPRRGLHLIRTIATNPPPNTTSTDLIKLAHAFLPTHPSLYTRALSSLHSCGYAIPATTAAAVLRTCAFELSADPKVLAGVIGWLGKGLNKPVGSAEEREAIEALCEGAMEGLKRMGKPVAVEDVFEAYAASFAKANPSQADTTWPGPSYPGPGVVSALISSRGLYDTLNSARTAFDAWRPAYLAATRSTSAPNSASLPPARPYLTLLSAYANNPPPPHSSPLVDSAYTFLPLLARDGLPLSPHMFALLVKLELSRRQFASCWGLWELMGRGRWCKGPEVWLAAVKVLSWEAKGVRGSRVGSPLARMAGYKPRVGPSGRELFAQLLVAEQDLTQGRPKLVLPGRAISTQLLNAFLTHFVDQADLPAAAVVLETFAVHGLEPSRATHSAVVLGLVEGWKVGKVGPALEQAAGVDAAELYEGARGGRGDAVRRQWDPPSNGSRVVNGAGEAERERAAMVLVRKLLEGRQMRVGLWTTPVGSRRDRLALADTAGVNGEEEEDGAELEGQPPAPEWMTRRELRDVGYLHELLRRASGGEGGEDGWQVKMDEVRGEVLPGRWGGGGSGAGAGEVEGGGERPSGLVEGKGLRRAGREERLGRWKVRKAGASLSGKRITTDKINLAANSVVFRTMIDLARSDDQVEEVPVTEKAQAMYRVLAYCGPGQVQPVDIAADLAGFWALARVADKFEVGRALDALASALKLESITSQSLAQTTARAYLYAYNFSPVNLPSVVKSIVDQRLPWIKLALYFDEAAYYGVTDGDKLQTFLAKLSKLPVAQAAVNVAAARCANSSWDSPESRVAFDVLQAVLDIPLPTTVG